MSHLSTAKSCKWYRKGKNKVIIAQEIPEPVEVEALLDRDSMNMEVDEADFQDIIQNGNLFQFVLPTEWAEIDVEVANEQASSSAPASAPRYNTIRPPALDDDEDPRVYEEDASAGMVIAMAPTIVNTWKAYFGDPDGGSVRMDVDGEDGGDQTNVKDPDAPWRPFASELDWKVAMWAVREYVGQNSLNRFLSIPGVSRIILGACPSAMVANALARWLND